MLDPQGDFCPIEIDSEIRFDPLTGQTGRVAHLMPRNLPPPDLTEWQRFAQNQTCPFCPGQLEKITPQFDRNIAPQGRIAKGEAIVFPNRFPYDEYSAVTVMAAGHLMYPREFTRGHLADAFEASQAFLAMVQNEKPGLIPYLLWNFLPPAGSSQLHPHLQVFATSVPGNSISVEQAAEDEYRRKHGCCFWDELIGSEKKTGERYLGRIGSIEWLVAFRPYGVIGDLIGVFPMGELLPEIDNSRWADLADGLGRAFAFFQDNNMPAFNMALYQTGSRLRFRLTPRLYVQPGIYASDVNALSMLFSEPITMVYPEDLAARIKPYFAVP